MRIEVYETGIDTNLQIDYEEEEGETKQNELKSVAFTYVENQSINPIEIEQDEQINNRQKKNPHSQTKLKK